MPGRSNILLIGRKSTSQDVLSTKLSAERYRVGIVETGQGALDSVGVAPPDLILLSADLPDMDRVALCRHLKASQAAPGIPVILLGSATEAEQQEDLAALGVCDFLAPPFRREELLVRVRTQLELRHLRTEVQGMVTRQTAHLRVAVEQLQREVAERRLAERAAQESEERFRNMADTAPMMIWVSGPDKRGTFFNKVWLEFTGRALEQELGTGWFDIVHPEDVDRVLGICLAAFEARSSFQMEYRMRRADGEYRWVLDKGVPRFIRHGVFAGYIGSCVDITEVRRSREEAFDRERVESLRVLTGGLAHDFNNLLGSIIADAELAEVNLAEGSSPIEEVQAIKAVAIRASEIVRELMVYAGEYKTSVEAVDVSALVEEMLELLKVSIPKRVFLDLDLPKSLPVVVGNRTQIRQIIMNLIINASEAIGREAGVIKIATSCVTGGQDLAPDDSAALISGSYLRLAVSDNGTGMTDEAKARIFDPFFTTKFGGHGLGLAVVQGIVRSHGGAIHVRTAPGLGTTFEILLPCTGETPARPQHSTGSDSVESPLTPGTILLVEDEDTLRSAVGKALTKRGFSVLAAGDGREAVQSFEAHANNIQVVLMDVTLPDMSGLTVSDQMRQIRPDVRIVFTTGYDRALFGDVPSGEKDQPRLLPKPYLISDLLRTLREAIAVGV